MSQLPLSDLAHMEHPAIGVVTLSRLLGELGHDPDPWLQAEGLPPSKSLLATATVEGARELGFVLRVLASVAIPHLGLIVGQRHHFSVFGMWGLALVSSSTLRDAIRVGLRYIDLVHTFLDWRFIDEPERPRLVADEPYDLGAARRFVVERDLAGCNSLLIDLLGHREALERVSLPFAAPEDATPYQAVFGCEVQFDADRAALEIAPSALESKPVQANSMAARLAEEQCRRLVSQMTTNGGVTAALRRQLLATPGRLPSLPEVAEHLHVSERGLRRKLAAERSSYRVVLAQVRETLARAYLRDTGLHLDEIAERLGYSDAANFSHAFRRWTGTAPGRFREETRTRGGQARER